MKFTLRIDMDNAAFSEDDREESPGARGAEVARIMRDVARSVEDGLSLEDAGHVRDANGNTCGAWDVTRGSWKKRRPKPRPESETMHLRCPPYDGAPEGERIAEGDGSDG